MYRYDEFDHAFVAQRVAQFQNQVDRRLDGELTEDEFKPLRLMNGLYLQLHAYMLRVAIPYGVLSSAQMRQLAHIARTYDKDYGHFTTRQNIQYNWPKLKDVPAILHDLADVEMHAIQTSGNCIRNVTADPYAGVAADEVDDPRVYAEILRQWSTLHPEFAFLPRKFKFALSGAVEDRAAVKLHDIGLYIRRNEAGEVGFEVLVGGGQGRTPIIAKTICDFLPKQHLLSYMEAIMRVYNEHGRRDNKYKARIKILLNATGVDEFRHQVEAQWEQIKDRDYDLPESEMQRIQTYFAPPDYDVLDATQKSFELQKFEDPVFGTWVKNNVVGHKRPGYAVANISLKPVGGIPGDATSEQMDVVADLADRYSFGEIRVTHRQNLVLPDVKLTDLFALFEELHQYGLSTPNHGRATDIIACPGLDYCSLANARAIPVAQRLSERLHEIRAVHDLRDMHLNISGCINACGHHHVGAIGILGVDRRGEEFYQITLGGSAFEDASIGDIIGPAFASDDVVEAVENIIRTYVNNREGEERFIDTYRRVGLKLFKEKLYGTD
ncbi:MAG: nitrite/sulfite reductase [Rhodospirillales bacterium]|jgi:sulfite reductase (NADPH) hemoprotein beta-component|nr:nitrite/sulfite reductase [Rhodospirillales bacterium]MBT4625317.1 nitrite/sulfite reductase [Rhodospirillales bacterium]MBT5353265.1 nitrite/sulfite reductase [Rhodospirillales bacterium]MBT5521762.1 nitrite/sulfite reductase [Rhodospirillales bacterium]MBT6827290.1 nitrite/sulfite reductase [Rhodospirillales bacterium]